MINPQWFELPMSRIDFDGPKAVRVYLLSKQCEKFENQRSNITGRGYGEVKYRMRHIISHP